MTDFQTFKKNFSWYRNLSLELIRHFPEEHMKTKISERSLPVNIQFIDLGEMQLKIAEKSLNKTFPITKPSEDCISKEEIIDYINNVNEIVMKEFEIADRDSTQLDWFGRMKFDYDETLTFMLAHEAMHHGEILSLIYAKGIEMPIPFRKTWGFERNGI